MEDSEETGQDTEGGIHPRMGEELQDPEEEEEMVTAVAVQRYSVVVADNKDQE